MMDGTLTMTNIPLASVGDTIRKLRPQHSSIALTCLDDPKGRRIQNGTTEISLRGEMCDGCIKAPREPSLQVSI